MDYTNKLPGVFALIKQSLFFYKKHYKKIIPVGLVILGIYVIETVISAVILPGGFSLKEGLPSVSSIIVFIVVSIVFSVVNFVVQIILPVVYTKTIKECDSGGVSNPKDLYKFSFKIFWSALWISILVALITLGTGIFFFIPAIAAVGYIYFATYFLVIDDIRGLNTLTTSFHYVRGNWWRVFWRGFALSLIILAIGIIILALVFLIMYFSSLISLSSYNAFVESIILISQKLQGFSFLSIIINLVAIFIVVCIFYPLITSYSYFLFKGLKTLKPAPNLTTDLKTVRGWFMGLSIFGLVVFVTLIIFMTIVPLVFGIVSGYKKAQTMNTTNLQEQSYVQPQIKFTQSDDKKSTNVSTTGKVLGNERYVNNSTGFSIKVPQGWKAEEQANSTDGVLISDASEKEITKIIQIQYFPTVNIISDSVAELLMKEILKNSTDVDSKSLTYNKIYIGPALTYKMAGRFIGIDRSIEYYLITSESGGLHVITTAWGDNVSLEDKKMISESISTFLPLK